MADIKLGQAIKENCLAEHVNMGVKSVRKFLEKFDLDETAKNKIINCVEAHHKAVPFDCIEAEICANADCYRFIHPRGFLAYLNFLGKRYPDFDECLDQAEQKMDEKHDILSLDICKQELEGHYKSFKSLIKEAKKK